VPQKMDWTKIINKRGCAQRGYSLPPIVSATQLTPLYIKAAYIAVLHRYSEAGLTERS